MKNTPVGNPPDRYEGGLACGACDYVEELFYDGETGGWDHINDPVTEFINEENQMRIRLCNGCIDRLEFEEW